VETEAVRSYVAAGVLVPDESGMFHAPDIARTRLVAALIDAGVDLDDLAAAIRDDRLSLGYVDHLMPDPVRLVPAPSAGDAAAPLAYEEVGIHRRQGHEEADSSLHGHDPRDFAGSA
jgi:hypothetical protein